MAVPDFHKEGLMKCIEYFIARGDCPTQIISMVEGWFPEDANASRSANPIWHSDNIEFAKLVYNHVSYDMAEIMYDMSEDEELLVLLRMFWKFNWVPIKKVWSTKLIT